MAEQSACPVCGYFGCRGHQRAPTDEWLTADDGRRVNLSAVLRRGHDDAERLRRRIEGLERDLERERSRSEELTEAIFEMRATRL